MSAVILIGRPAVGGETSTLGTLAHFRHSRHLNKLRPSTSFKGVTKSRALRARIITHFLRFFARQIQSANQSTKRICPP